jgi:hypothetical protein
VVAVEIDEIKIKKSKTSTPSPNKEDIKQSTSEKGGTNDPLI